MFLEDARKIKKLFQEWFSCCRKLTKILAEKVEKAFCNKFDFFEN